MSTLELILHIFVLFAGAIIAWAIAMPIMHRIGDAKTAPILAVSATVLIAVIFLCAASFFVGMSL